MNFPVCSGFAKQKTFHAWEKPSVDVILSAARAPFFLKRAAESEIVVVCRRLRVNSGLITTDHTAGVGACSG